MVIAICNDSLRIHTCTEYTLLNSSDELRCIYLGYFIYPIKGPDRDRDHKPKSSSAVEKSPEQPTHENKDKERGKPAGVLTSSIVSAANEQPVCRVLSLTDFGSSKFDERTDGQEQASC